MLRQEPTSNDVKILRAKAILRRAQSKEAASAVLWLISLVLITVAVAVSAFSYLDTPAAWSVVIGTAGVLVGGTGLIIARSKVV